ncbi:hypothetical protein NC653_036035 [Populus alba x Populus x berolinensis]|uniref:Uncharacterized protein n=1 Tax=Populus alba x Populus x berolinensis TaxID=444605 RepID=A0AAD6PUE2_9ROSI|nr:hypothetical protein NC653_036035 [Populus alba x Populus x berolinensis]
MQLGGRTLSITNQFTCPKSRSPNGLSSYQLLRRKYYAQNPWL